MTTKLAKIRDFEKEDWFKSLADDCGSAMVEGEFTARWALIEAYHSVGRRIRVEEDRVPITELVQTLAVRTKISTRKYWYAVQIYDKWPSLSRLPGGKEVTLNKLITRYLPEKEKGECKHEPMILEITICKKCRMRL